jgi:hypothetical protein
MIDTTQTNLANTIFLFDTSFEHGILKYERHLKQ